MKFSIPKSSLKDDTEEVKDKYFIITITDTRHHRRSHSFSLATLCLCFIEKGKNMIGS